MSVTGLPPLHARFFNAATPRRAAIAAANATLQACMRSSAVKMASVPSPISLSTSPPCFVDRRDDRVGIVVEQRNDLFRRGVGDPGEAAQIAEPDNGIDVLGNAAHDASAEHAPAGVAAEIGFHQRLVMRASDTDLMASARYGATRSSAAMWPSLKPSGARVAHENTRHPSRR